MRGCRRLTRADATPEHHHQSPIARRLAPSPPSCPRKRWPHPPGPDHSSSYRGFSTRGEPSSIQRLRAATKRVLRARTSGPSSQTTRAIPPSARCHPTHDVTASRMPSALPESRSVTRGHIARTSARAGGAASNDIWMSATDPAFSSPISAHAQRPNSSGRGPLGSSVRVASRHATTDRSGRRTRSQPKSASV